MKKVYSILILQIICFNLYAQIEVGYGFDASAKAIDNYYDQLLYNTDKPISILHTDPTFEYGYYITTEGVKNEGLLKLVEKKLTYKKEVNDSKSIKLKIKEIQSAVIGLDSFFVINSYKTNGDKGNVKQRRFLKHIVAYDNIHYASFTEKGIEHFFAKEGKDASWGNFAGSNKDFREKAIRNFGHIPEIKRKIESKEYKKKDLNTIINTYRYHKSMEAKKPIYFDKYWNETFSAQKAKYKAIVEAKEDTLYKVIYYQANNKLYEAYYSSFYPNIKQGNFTCFYPNEKKRQTLNFSNDTLKSKNVYSENNVLLKTYIYDNYITSKGETQSVNYAYLNGKETIDGNYDYVNTNTYHQKFVNTELIQSYYQNDTSRIYQFCKESKDFKHKELENKLQYFIRFNKYSECLNENAEGIIFVSFIVDKKGYIKNYKIRNTLHPELDDLMAKFCKSIGPEANNRYKLGEYIVDEVNVDYEVIVPFEFMINREYRKPFRYLWLLGSPYKYNIYHLQFNGVNMMGPMMTPVPMGF